MICINMVFAMELDMLSPIDDRVFIVHCAVVVLSMEMGTRWCGARDDDTSLVRP